MTDEKEILEEGKKILEEFSEALKDVPETEETHYVIDLKNVTREDSPGSCSEEFEEKFKKLAPRVVDGYIKVEK